ncbi:MAG: hypothetical protein GVY20_09560 [Bacteroidetes bacterium]|nr:hypothetical protein [Bacteroidota bacterium]
MKLYLSLGLLSLIFIESCSDTGSSGQVKLYPGDNFQQANDNFPAGTVFVIANGLHQKQRVHNPKSGNVWLGEKGAIMDGLNSITAAFTGKAINVSIQGVEIRNYVDNGIYFDAGEKVSFKRLRITDTGSGTGELNGAIRLNDVSDITVSHSHFARVSSAILPSYCEGPILIDWNTGINIGRNFVQLGKCSGKNIRIEYNTMERKGDYLRPGARDVEDWISIYRSSGTADSPIQVRYNRARGHGHSKYGSFIMLGDAGGKHQLAYGNVGVTPGQVGIGIAGGEDIKVDSNILYSDEWRDSNIALYSADYSEPEPCNNHIITNNRSLWYNRTGVQNNLWSDQDCNPILENNTYPDYSLNHSIWESSKAARGN